MEAVDRGAGAVGAILGLPRYTAGVFDRRAWPAARPLPRRATGVPRTGRGGCSLEEKGQGRARASGPAE